MSKKNTMKDVQELLAGSRRIDEMRKEIKRFLRGLDALAFVALQAGVEPGVTEPITQNLFGYYNVRILLVPDPYARQAMVQLRSGSVEIHAESIPLDKVQNVFEALPLVLDSLLEVFPGIEEDLEILRRAAKA